MTRNCMPVVITNIASVLLSCPVPCEKLLTDSLSATTANMHTENDTLRRSLKNWHLKLEDVDVFVYAVIADDINEWKAFQNSRRPTRDVETYVMPTARQQCSRHDFSYSQDIHYFDASYTVGFQHFGTYFYRLLFCGRCLHKQFFSAV